jgi:hypothetical protein
MLKMRKSEIARLIGISPQNLQHREKVGKFMPDTNISGKVIIPADFENLLNAGYHPMEWEVYRKNKDTVKLVDIVDFYGIPVAFVVGKSNQMKGESNGK